jgi:hypothetical protein
LIIKQLMTTTLKNTEGDAFYSAVLVWSSVCFVGFGGAHLIAGVKSAEQARGVRCVEDCVSASNIA